MGGLIAATATTTMKFVNQKFPYRYRENPVLMLGNRREKGNYPVAKYTRDVTFTRFFLISGHLYRDVR